MLRQRFFQAFRRQVRHVKDRCDLNLNRITFVQCLGKTLKFSGNVPGKIDRFAFRIRKVHPALFFEDAFHIRNLILKVLDLT